MVRDQIGKRHGKYTIVSHGMVNGKILYLAECDCGNSNWLGLSRIKKNKVGCFKCFAKTQKGASRSKIAFDKEFGVKKLYRLYRSNSIKIGLPFELSIETFECLTSTICHYCHSQPSSLVKSRNGLITAYIYNGIDRKDNSKGYTETNSLPCCSRCNYLKGRFNYNEFIDAVQAIAKIFNHNQF